MKVASALMVSGLLFTNSAMAKEMFFEIRANALGYSMSSITNTPDASGTTAVKTTTTGLTTPTSLEFYGMIGKVGVDIIPGSQMVGLNYNVTDAINVGMDVGLDSTSKKTDTAGAKEDKGTKTTLAPYALYTHDLGGCKVEGQLGLTYGMSSTVTGSETTAEDSSMDIGLLANYVHAFSENVDYAAGLSYTMKSVTTTKPEASKGKDSGYDLSLNLAQLRFHF